MKIHLDNPYVLLGWDDELRAVVFKWKKFATSEAYREAMNLTITLLEQNSGNLIMCDSTHQGVISLEDQRWTTEEWNPHAIRAGLKKTAILMPEKVVTQMAIDKMKKQVEMRHNADEAAYFYDEAQARAWLLS
jgi:hypothetical protein